MKSKYEISIWSDIYDPEKERFTEQKEVIIGSDTMTSENRAREPKLVNNINGTNQFTFSLYYRYIDTRTGEEIVNPYVAYLINERRVKVFWKDEWYDFLVKSIKEDQAGRVFTYTCEDSYITELSRTGFELEFATELQNNIGTPQELIEKVIANTDWRYDTERSEIIYQETEEPVYEVNINYQYTAQKCPTGEGTLHKNHKALLYYSCANDIKNLKNNIQLCYADEYERDQNDMLVINGNCYNLTVDWEVDEDTYTAWATPEEESSPLFQLEFSSSISKEYRAKRYVQSQKTEYSDILERYVNVYEHVTEVDDKGNPKLIYGYVSTEYNDALAVVNLVTNPSNFKNTSGWRRPDDEPGLYFRLSPTFDSTTDITHYNPISFLYVMAGYTFNTGILNNKTYIQNGFIEGERYIFRIKVRSGLSSEPGNENCISIINGQLTPSIESRDLDYYPTGTQYFTIINKTYTSEEWNEFEMECCKSCAYDNISDSSSPFGIFINASEAYWIEDMQFYRKVEGVDSSGNPKRIDPNQMSTQSVAQQYWKYFWAEQQLDITKDTLEYIYVSLEEWDKAIPVNNNYQRYGTIEADNSNRFNILQSIAETFQCWIRFQIEHDDNGYITYDDSGLPCKFIQVTRDTGEETGIGFLYGVDLQGVTRNIKSDKISTKTIVEQNNNEFGENGFCSIARSEQNYPRENFIYNFDYYIQQGLLDKNVLYNDLYAVKGYYNQLHNNNVDYAKNLEELVNKKLELTKQKATSVVYNQYISASAEELNTIADSLIKLAGTQDDGDEAFKNALVYAKTHANNTKVQALVNDYYSTKTTNETYHSLNNDLNDSLLALQQYIESHDAEQNRIIEDLRALNQWFYVKYSRFIQEGTWTSEDYWNDDLYYLDAVQVAYESSRPQISYDINVLRLSELEDYSSKVFHLGDISFIQDTEYFGYKEDKITPYKEKVVLTEITSYFDTPDKDVIKVQNYKSQFDDLFQRITAQVQSLEFTQGKYARAASIMTTDGTIRSSVIQNTFNENKDLVYGAQNESATIDNTGITVTDNGNAAKQVKITSGGLFVTEDGGATWKNAVRGDGISADVVTTGKLNTEAITIYGADAPSFTWDQYGINAYLFDEGGKTDSKYKHVGQIEESAFNNDLYFTKSGDVYTEAEEWSASADYYVSTHATSYNQFVRFDKFGLYGIKGKENYQPVSESQIYRDAKFGLTWNKFFMKNSNGDKYIEISTDKDIVINEQGINRIVIGRVDGGESDSYGMRIRNSNNEVIFECGNLNGSEKATIAGWSFTPEYLESDPGRNDQTIKIYANGNIGCYEQGEASKKEPAYQIQLTAPLTAFSLEENSSTASIIPSGSSIWLFSSGISNTTQRTEKGRDDQSLHIPTADYYPRNKLVIQFVYNNTNYKATLGEWYFNNDITQQVTCTPNEIEVTNTETSQPTYYTQYIYKFKLIGKQNNNNVFTILYGLSTTEVNKYIPASNTKWYIDNNGDAIFHNITADGGNIAGWFIDDEKIYQTYNGLPDGPIKTQLNSNGSNSGGIDYSIITDAIEAAIATVGGVWLANGMINGYRIEDVYNLANYAAGRANEAYTKATTHTHSISRIGPVTCLTPIGQTDMYSCPENTGSVN